jgi:PKHD-type hydroxylase
VIDRLWDVAVKANEIYRYKIDRFQGPVQLAIYDEKNQGFYRWHMDIAPRSTTRKISITMPLNEPSEYEGGNLELNGAGVPNKVPQQQGTVITFPSFILHRVTPVTKGTRYSLVAWITGPAWS